MGKVAKVGWINNFGENYLLRKLKRRVYNTPVMR